MSSINISNHTLTATIEATNNKIEASVALIGTMEAAKKTYDKHLLEAKAQKAAELDEASQEKKEEEKANIQDYKDGKLALEAKFEEGKLRAASNFKSAKKEAISAGFHVMKTNLQETDLECAPTVHAHNLASAKDVLARQQNKEQKTQNALQEPILPCQVGHQEQP